MDVISLQSRVETGYVGNAVAVPVLQAMGVRALPVDTVVLAHHPGHGPVTPNVTPAPELSERLAAAIAGCTAPACLLSGYLVNVEQGHAALHELEKARDAGRIGSYYLDPVFGDIDKGVYVDPALVDFYRDEALPRSTVLLPNRFELAVLSGRETDSIDNAVAAARTLIDKGPSLVLVSSVPATAPDGGDTLSNVLVSADDAFCVSVPVLSLHAKGTGDMLSAAFAGLHASGTDAGRAQQVSVALVEAAAAEASGRNGRELDPPKVLNLLNFTPSYTHPVRPIELLDQRSAK